MSFAIAGVVAWTVSCQGAKASLPEGVDVEVGWAVSPDPWTAGYRVHYRTAESGSDFTEDVGLASRHVLSGLPTTTRCFVTVTAYNLWGLESSPSEEITFVTRSKPLAVSSSEELPDLATGLDPNLTFDVFGSADEDGPGVLLGTVTTRDEEHSFLPLEGSEEVDVGFVQFESRGESFDAWLAARGWSDPGGDGDGDGIGNLQAFLTGSDRFAVAREALPSVQIVEEEVDGDLARFAAFSYTYRVHVADFALVVESSEDLSTWRDGSEHLVEVSRSFNENGTRTVVLREREPVASGGSGQRHYRLRFLSLNPIFAVWMDDQGIVDPFLDPDGDGMHHFTAFASGADLLSDASTSGLGLRFRDVAVPGGSARHAVLTYTLREGLPGVEVMIESSPDLVNWGTATGEFTMQESVLRRDGTRLVTLLERTPMEGASRYFRIRYLSSEPWAIGTSNGLDILSLPVGNSFDAWMAAKGWSDPLADPDDNGMNHFADFVSGADLLGDPREARLELQIAEDSSGGPEGWFASFSFTLRAGAVGVEAVLESSTDGAVWTDASAEVIEISRVPREDGTLLVVQRAIDPLGSATRLFRLRYAATQE